MEKLIEFYEMVYLNDAALGPGEKAAILEARRGLRLFARAMERFKRDSIDPWPAEQELRLAA